MDSSFIRVYKARLINTIGEQAFVGEELDGIGISFDLIDVAVLVIELAANTIGTLFRLEEGFAIFISSLWFLSRLLLTVAVSEFALISVPAMADFDPVFAELSLVFGLIFVLLDNLWLASRLFRAPNC